MAELLQKVNRNEKSICGKCSHRFVCFGINNQPCFECNRFEEEVVRCKDCVNYCGFEHCKNGICDVDSVSKRAVYPNDFCSYGERRTDD